MKKWKRKTTTEKALIVIAGVLLAPVVIAGAVGVVKLGGMAYDKIRNDKPIKG